MIFANMLKLVPEAAELRLENRSRAEDMTEGPALGFGFFAFGPSDPPSRSFLFDVFSITGWEYAFFANAARSERRAGSMVMMAQITERLDQLLWCRRLSDPSVSWRSSHCFPQLMHAVSTRSPPLIAFPVPADSVSRSRPLRHFDSVIQFQNGTCDQSPA